MVPENEGRWRADPLIMAFWIFLEEDFEEFRLHWVYSCGVQAPTLLDVVDGWLTHGKAALACDGRFDLFLVAIIKITAQWASGNFFDLPFWRDEDGNGQPLAGFSIVSAEPALLDPVQHRVMNRIRFDEMYIANRLSMS